MTLYFCPDCSTYTYHTTDEDEVATCEQCGCETVLNTTPWHKKPLVFIRKNNYQRFPGL
jgi:hypothetical protein